MAQRHPSLVAQRQRVQHAITVVQRDLLRPGAIDRIVISKHAAAGGAWKKHVRPAPSVNDSGGASLRFIESTGARVVVAPGA